MSLQAAAQHLASRGRGPDTTLVHMAPQEVAGLQALAKAHGGTLTINPETGLAEAGFLKNLLPAILGAALTATTGIPAARARRTKATLRVSSPRRWWRSCSMRSCRSRAIHTAVCWP